MDALPSSALRYAIIYACNRSKRDVRDKCKCHGASFRTNDFARVTRETDFIFGNFLNYAQTLAKPTLSFSPRERA